MTATHITKQQPTSVWHCANAVSLIDTCYVKLDAVNVRVWRVISHAIIRTPTHMMDKLSTALITEYTPTVRAKIEQ